MIDVTKPMELEDGTPISVVPAQIFKTNENLPSSNYRKYINVIDNNRVRTFYVDDGSPYSFQDGYIKLRNKIMIDFTKPLLLNGKEAKIIHTFEDGKVAVVSEGVSLVITFSPDGTNNVNSSYKLTNKMDRVELFYNCYPNSRVIYTHETKYDADKGMGNIKGNFQVKVVTKNGVIVSKEFLD